MKWIVVAILVFIPVYTYLTLHYRRPGPSFNPYRDMRDRADVIRLLKAGYRRVAIDASRLVDEDAPRASAGSPAPGGLPQELRKTLVETPLLPLEINSVSAPPTAVAAIGYSIGLTYTIPDNKRQLSGAHLYEREGEIVDRRRLRAAGRGAPLEDARRRRAPRDPARARSGPAPTR